MVRGRVQSGFDGLGGLVLRTQQRRQGCHDDGDIFHVPLVVRGIYLVRSLAHWCCRATHVQYTSTAGNIP